MATPQLGRGLDALEAALRAERISEPAVLDLRLVAEEVLTNVAKYAHHDTAEHSVSLRLTLLGDTVCLEFRDDGQPFDPLTAAVSDLSSDARERAVGGLGLHLIRALVDEAKYARVDDQNVLTLTRRLGGVRDVP